MISYFPTPYNDELFYSLCARYGSRVAYPNAKFLLLDLFGAPTASAVVDFPNRLRFFAEALPTGTSLTVDRLIDRHTLFPFFSAFLPSNRANQIREDMQISSGPAAHMRSGVMGSSIPTISRLRFCSKCKQEDEKRYGEPYWHRIHQLHGVEVCLRHHVFLENCSVALRAGRNHLLFISAAQAACEGPIRRVDITNRNHQILLRIAEDATWLLRRSSCGTSLKALYNRYLRLLIKRGLATYTGSIHARRLIEEFNCYYSPAFLKLLHCELRGSDLEKSNWLLRLVRRSKYAVHPLYHLLLMQFLGCTVEEFFQLPKELNFFGEGPWLCLNPAAGHYKQPVIKEYRPGKRLRNNKPVGIFNCECGFSYARTGPDISREDMLRIGKVISFGLVWETKLKKLWKDSTLSMSEIGRQLGVDPLTVRRHAARLKLPLIRSGRRTKRLNPSMRLKGNSSLATWKKRRYTCRSKWFSAIKQNQKITMKALRSKLPREYAWLLRNDSQWLERHKPSPKNRIQTKSNIDWRRRDAEHAAAVRVTVSSLKNAPGRPVRVTKTAIGRAIGAVTLLQQKLHKMPLTAQVLASVVETRKDYAVRRVWWAARCYQQEGIIARIWQLILRANVYRWRKAIQVQSALDAAIEMLEQSIPVLIKLSAG
jgi:hypothetical protein